MRRSPAMSLVVLPLLLAAACGGSEATGQKKSAAPLADAPRATTPAPREVTVVLDGRKRRISTTSATVQEALSQAGITLGEHDLVTPPRTAPLTDVIKVVRLLSAPRTKVVKLPPQTVRRKDAKLPPFTEKEVRKGRPGVKILQVAWVRRGGKKVQTVLSQKIKSRPVARIVAVGPQGASVGSVANLNWNGLAKCESGNNPRAVNPAGYYGLYQFSLPSWQSVGGSGKPSEASPAEQTYRAQMLYKKVNGRWQGQWPHCGKFLFS
ncbi:hypothetical protein GCM10009678_36820 [Actinomadura kijaniata]|uniref:G5 domain-containing protein n=1 Tax=Actinomadura namibiensis TaxID=182080 RepID=A0A7W3LZK9_ACTNM|nr:transglycosylase family protein [Actinomadura namibiensis]MBA8957152.1 hypothetical protein [Actinomadura namibiensis]